MRNKLSWWDRSGLLALWAFFGVFLAYPLAYALGKAFVVKGKVSFALFPLLFNNLILRESIVTSLVIAAWVTAGCAAVGAVCAWLLCRTTMRGRALWGTLLLTPMVLPPFVGAIGIKQVLGRMGMVNMFCIQHGWMNPQSPTDWLGNPFWGVVVLEVLHLFPIMYLNLVSGFSLMDAAVEEAGRSLGASGSALFRTVTAPLLLPGFFAGATIVFIWAFTELGTPLIFEFRNVVPVQVFDMVKESGENPLGYALVVTVLLLTVFFFGMARQLFGRRRYEMPAFGRSGVREWRMPFWAQVPAQVGMALFLALALAPHVSVLLVSLSKEWFLTVLPEKWTLAHYGMVFRHPVSMGAVKNSLMLSSVSTVVVLIAGGFAAYLMSRKRFIGESALDMVCMAPLAIPGVILAFGYVGSFSGTGLDPRVNPYALLVAAYTLRRLPIVVRAVFAGFQQMGRTLEEASAALGAGPVATMRRVSLPLISASLVGAAVLSFAFAMLEVSDSLILAMQEKFYPITKAIYELMGRLSDGVYMASAMGILGLALLGLSLVVAQRLLGKRMGDMFRA